MIREKIISIILIVFSLLAIILPNYCNAEIVDLGYKNIDATSSLTIRELYFYPINFRDFSNTSEMFGLAGTVVNIGSSAKTFIATAEFYDTNYNLVATLESSQDVLANQKNSYNHVGNISKIKSGYTVDDIKYYKLSVETKDVTTSTTTSSSTNSNSSKYNDSNYDYVINSYNIDMVVNENNTFDITETITAYFNVPKHGIFRKVPLKNSITRLDGTKSNNKAQITNISVNEDYTTYSEEGYKVIKIGDANKTLTGSQTYKIYI